MLTWYLDLLVPIPREDGESVLLDVVRYLPERLRPLLRYATDVQEVRLRVGRALAVVSGGVERYPQPDGTLSECSHYGAVCTPLDLSQTFESVCDHSVHSHSLELSQGYVTVAGGSRVGFCGTYVFRGDALHTVKDVSSIDFRVAQEFRGCANELFQMADYTERPRGVLIVGRPMSAKTTVLRDLCRLVSSRYRVSLVDERSEVASTYRGVPQCDVGLRTDVFDGYPKGVGISMAVRTMSPDVVFCDEVGTAQDFQALEAGSVCGVKFVCTAHADSVERVLSLPSLRNVLQTDAFDYVALLGHGSDFGRVVDFRTVHP